MTPEDILYLRAELARAGQQGLETTLIRVRDLQSVLDRYARALAAAPADVKICGFVHPGELRNFRCGSLPELVMKRSITTSHTEPLFRGLSEEVPQ